MQREKFTRTLSTEQKEMKPADPPETPDVDLIEMKGNHIRNIPLFLSEFGWILLVGLFIASGFIFPKYHPAQTFFSKNATRPWNSEENITMFSHLTDIHVSKVETEKIINSLLVFQVMRQYNLDFHLITGDIVDNYGKKEFPKIGKQTKGDWKMFRDIIEEELDNQPIIDVAGNHDMFAIKSPISKENLYLKYSYTFNRTNTFTEEEFYCKKIVRSNITFVLINNYQFPTLHPPYAYWAHPTRKILDRIEEVIESAGPCVVAMHYCVDYNWKMTSSKGHTFEEIMQFPNVEYIFSGHLHPKNTLMIHHKEGGLEFVGVSAHQHKGLAIVTIDNGRLVYHPMRLYHIPPKFFMTNPVPLEMISSHQVFNERGTELRVISYAGKNVTLTASGAVNGILRYVRKLPNGADLYSIPIDLPEGIYTVNVSGDECDITRQFVIGNQFRGKKEEYTLLYRGFLFIKISAIPVFICLFIILFPLNIWTFTDVENWILGKSSKSHWLIVIFLSPFVLRKRMLNSPKLLRYFLFGVLFYPLILPNHFFSPINGMHGYSFLCFINIGGKILYDEWALFMTYFFYLVIMIPSTLFVSGISYQNHSCIYSFNQILMYILLFGICVVNFRWVGESVAWPLLCVNPTFVVIPLAIQIMIVLLVYRKKKDTIK